MVLKYGAVCLPPVVFFHGDCIMSVHMRNTVHSKVTAVAARKFCDAPFKRCACIA